jgi:citrate synthase
MFSLLGAEPPEIPMMVAAARTAGMVAMVREALDTIRLYRPLSHYVGPSPRSLGTAGTNG